MTGDIRIGIVGAGAIAPVSALPALAARSDVTIAGLVERDPIRLAATMRRWSIQASYPSVAEMIDRAKLSALVVLTPKDSHTEFVELGLRAGLDVFCEKPLAAELDEARHLAALADAGGLILSVGFNRRHSEVYRIARDVFDPADVLLCVAQKNRQGTEYRATLENAIHMVDLLRWFCGDAIDVSAHAQATDRFREDGAAALLRFAGGSIAVLMAARSAGVWQEQFHAHGNGTSVTVRYPTSVSIHRNGREEVTEIRPRSMGWARPFVSCGYQGEIDDFIACIGSRSQPEANGQEAVRTQELTMRILRAAGLPTGDSQQVQAVERLSRATLRQPT